MLFIKKCKTDNFSLIFNARDVHLKEKGKTSVCMSNVCRDLKTSQEGLASKEKKTIAKNTLDVVFLKVDSNRFEIGLKFLPSLIFPVIFLIRD